MRNKLLALGFVAFLAACATQGQGQAVLTTCNTAYGTLGVLSNLRDAGKWTPTPEQQTNINVMIRTVIHPICFAQYPIEETSDNLSAIKKVAKDLLAIQNGVK